MKLIEELAEKPRWNSLTKTIEVSIIDKVIEEDVRLEDFKSIYSQFWYLEEDQPFRESFKLSESDLQLIDNEIPEKLRNLFDFEVDVYFSNCEFKRSVTGNRWIESNFIFDNQCKFKGGFIFPNSNFFGKLRIRNCHFYDTDFYNTTFSDLADFYKCDFHKSVIFQKTDFLKISVFAACTFHENTLFTYTLIDKLVIFRGTRFLQWLDLSLSIGDGKFNLFDMKPEGFHKTSIDSHPLVISDQKTYDEAVTINAIIPLKNKRETLRILKQTLVSQGNISEALYFKSLEKETLWQELKAKENKTRQDYFDWFVLFLNRWSNNHGVSYWRAFWFIVLVGWVFFYSSAIFSNEYHFSGCICSESVTRGAIHFIQFLNPTHSLDYMANGKELNFWFYLFDYVGRVVVGYGIYQFVQAFRKFR